MALAIAFCCLQCAGEPDAAKAPPSITTSFCKSWMMRAQRLGSSRLSDLDAETDGGGEGVGAGMEGDGRGGGGAWELERGAGAPGRGRIKGSSRGPPLGLTENTACAAH